MEDTNTSNIPMKITRFFSFGFIYRSVIKYLGLSFVLAKAEFKLRNEGSYLGVFWYLLNPILTFVLLLLIFSQRLGSGIPQYPLYLMLGIIIFNLFQNVVIESMRLVIKDYRLIIKSINFPKESLLISILLKNLFSHFFEFLLFIILLLFFKISLIGIIYYLIVLVFLCIFIFGFSAILSALTVYFVDLDNILSFALRILWLATPIFYSIGGQTKLFYLNMLNPIYYFITAARDMVVYNNFPETWVIWGIVAWSLGFLAVGLFVFSKLKTKFAEMI